MDKPANVLCVDDVEIFTLLIGRLCQSLNMNPTLCYSASEAVEKLKARKYDLVITDDLIGSAMSGMDLLALLLKEHPKTPVIIMTAINKTDYIEEILGAGANDYLLKPFSKEVFDTKIDALLSKIREEMS